MRRLANHRGDTLIEVTLAFAILASVVAAVTGLAGVATRAGQTNRERVEAAAIMQQEAELLRNRRDTALLTPAQGWPSFVNALFGGAPIAGCGSSSKSYAKVFVPPSFPGETTWTAAADPQYGTGLGAGGQFVTVQTAHAGYSLWLTGCLVDPAASSNNQDLQLTLQVRWTALGGGAEQADLTTELANVGSVNQLANQFTPPPVPAPPLVPVACSSAAKLNITLSTTTDTEVGPGCSPGPDPRLAGPIAFSWNKPGCQSFFQSPPPYINGPVVEIWIQPTFSWDYALMMCANAGPANLFQQTGPPGSTMAPKSSDGAFFYRFTYLDTTASPSMLYLAMRKDSTTAPVPAMAYVSVTNVKTGGAQTTAVNVPSTQYQYYGVNVGALSLKPGDVFTVQLGFLNNQWTTTNPALFPVSDLNLYIRDMVLTTGAAP